MASSLQATWVRVAGLALLAFTACTSIGSESDATYSTSPAASSTTVEEPVKKGPEVRWGPVRENEGEYVAVLAIDRGFLAVERFGGVVKSIGETDWVRVSDDAFTPSHRFQFRDVATNGTEVVVAGIEGSEEASSAVVWVTRDGKSWERVQASVAEHAAYQGIETVTWIGTEFLAAGFETSPGEPSSVVVWVSPDGRTWDRLTDDSAFSGSAVEVAAAASGPNGIVIVGSRGDSPVGSAGAIWHSSDGRQWHQVPANPEIFGGDGYQWVSDVIAYQDQIHCRWWQRRVGHRLDFAGWTLLAGEP